MALDAFRRTDLIIDKATQRIDWQSPLRAVQGEYNGRSLRVQVTNDSVVEPQTAQLLFGFLCAANHNEGVYDMEAVDPSQGIYEVFYPTAMLEEPGSVACTIKIVENTGNGEADSHITILDGISVEVAVNPISGEAEVPENSIRVFDKALIDIAAHERRILIMELNFDDLTKLLTANIPNMDAPVSQIVTSIDMYFDRRFANYERAFAETSFPELLSEDSVTSLDDLLSKREVVFEANGRGAIYSVEIGHITPDGVYSGTRDADKGMHMGQVTFEIVVDGITYGEMGAYDIPDRDTPARGYLMPKLYVLDTRGYEKGPARSREPEMPSDLYYMYANMDNSYGGRIPLEDRYGARYSEPIYFDQEFKILAAGTRSLTSSASPPIKVDYGVRV